MHDGDPLPSFEGEPKLVSVCDDMDAFTDLLWNNLNEDNNCLLYTSSARSPDASAMGTLPYQTRTDAPD